MSTWIHCNICYQYYAEDVNFYMQSCSHILCAKCLKTAVIANGNECKMCKKPIRYKKIGPQMDPKLRECFDLHQNLKIEGMIQSLQVADIQFKHMTNEKTIMKMARRAESLKKMKKKLMEKNEVMAKYLEQKRKKKQMKKGADLRVQAMQKSMSSNTREFFLSSQTTVRKEPLLKIGSTSNSSGQSGFSRTSKCENSFQSTSSELPHQRKSDFVKASSVSSSAAVAGGNHRIPSAGLPIKRHPQITRLSKISALASEFSRQRISN